MTVFYNMMLMFHHGPIRNAFNRVMANIQEWPMDKPSQFYIKAIQHNDLEMLEWLHQLNPIKSTRDLNKIIQNIAMNKKSKIAQWSFDTQNHFMLISVRFKQYCDSDDEPSCKEIVLNSKLWLILEALNHTFNYYQEAAICIGLTILWMNLGA